MFHGTKVNFIAYEGNLSNFGTKLIVPRGCKTPVEMCVSVFFWQDSLKNGTI